MLGTDPKTDKENSDRERLTPSRIERYLDCLDRDTPTGVEIRGLSFGGEAPAVIAGTQGHYDFSTRANDIDLYVEIDVSEGNIGWEEHGFSVPESPGAEKMLQYHAGGGERDDGIIIDIQRDASIPMNSSEEMDEIASLELRDSEAFYKGDRLEVYAPSTEFFYVMKTETGAIHREEREKYKREIEKLNEAADKSFNPWAVYPSSDQSVGWRAEARLGDDFAAESIVDHLSDRVEENTNSLYKVEQRGSKYEVTAPDLVPAGNIATENDGQIVSVSTGFGSGSTFQEVAVLEKALSEVLNKNGIEHELEDWKYETENVGAVQEEVDNLTVSLSMSDL